MITAITEGKSRGIQEIQTSDLAATRLSGDLPDKAFALDQCLVGLVELRVVQIHGCEWTLSEQNQRLKAVGETDHRLHLLPDWRNQTIFTDREKAALNIAEALTLDPVENVREKAIQVLRLVFTEHEVVCLIAAILAVNDWFQTEGQR